MRLILDTVRLVAGCFIGTLIADHFLGATSAMALCVGWLIYGGACIIQRHETTI